MVNYNFCIPDSFLATESDHPFWLRRSTLTSNRHIGALDGTLSNAIVLRYKTSRFPLPPWCAEWDPHNQSGDKSLPIRRNEDGAPHRWLIPPSNCHGCMWREPLKSACCDWWRLSSGYGRAFRLSSYAHRGPSHPSACVQGVRSNTCSDPAPVNREPVHSRVHCHPPILLRLFAGKRLPIIMDFVFELLNSP